MIEVMLRSPSFAAFLIASAVLALTPGPGVLFLLTQTLSRGRPSGLASVAGIALGNLANAVLASLGLAVLMARARVPGRVSGRLAESKDGLVLRGVAAAM